MHLVYGFYIFSSVVDDDLSQALKDWICKTNMNIVVKEEENQKSTNADDLPPIVLVHGIFGFGKEVCEIFFLFPHYDLIGLFLAHLLLEKHCHLAIYVFSIGLRDWEVYYILQGLRKEMRRFWCLI